MEIKVNLFLLTFIVVLVGFPQDAESCSCRRSHPQTLYCQADFVILARIKRERVANSTKIYKVKIRKPYKMTEKAEVALKSGRLLTSVDSSLCGVDLNVGQLYAISGRIDALRANVNLCGMAIPWENLTRRQRKGLKLMYSKGCTCQIRECRGRCVGKKDVCNWTGECQTKEGTCLRSRSSRCMWTKNQKLTSCLKNETLTISRLSG